MYNLSHNVTNAHLQEMFGNCGLVKRAELAMDPASTGRAIVEMGARSLAVAAIEHLDGATVDDLSLIHI